VSNATRPTETARVHRAVRQRVGDVPLAARAQQSAVPVIGFLSSRSPAEAQAAVNAFRSGLGEVGYFEGKNVTIEFRWAEGHYDRLPALATELVNRKVSVIAATGGDVSALAAKAATTIIPIVFTAGGDAVESGLVSSFNRPGGNITGVNLFYTEMGAKRLELLRLLIPNASAIAMLVNPNSPTTSTDQKNVLAAARSIGAQVSVFAASDESDFEKAFANMVEQKNLALLIGDDPFLFSERDQLVRPSARHAIPTIYFSREFVDAGGLISYGTSITNGYRQTGFYVGRILKGDKADDLPVLQPTKFELVINLKTARALGLEIPPTLLARADEVIE
jgi:putative tryptophan/tyrosine transport system substrate-binding protein